jgi:uncharacterized membrane protein required for colicin V production
MSTAGALSLFLPGALLAAGKVTLDSWQLGFFGAAALFVGLTTWHGWRLGLIRQVINILALVAAYVIGYFGGGTIGPLLRRFLDIPEGVLAVLGAVTLGLVIYVCIILIGAIAFKKTAQQSIGLVKLGYGLSGAFCGALYGLFLVWIMILAIRLLGSVAETQIAVAKNPHLNLGGQTPTPTPSPTPPSAMIRGLAHMKHSLEQGAAGAMVQQVDPIPGTLYSMLHKLGVMVADERKVVRFLSYPGVKPLLDHPKIAALQNDPDITRDILQRNYLGLIRNRRIIVAANDAEIGELMRKFEFEKALDHAIHGPEKAPARTEPRR